jgi:endonuclease/exonuclease/phosphatase family metal-dependent hydrolase
MDRTRRRMPRGPGLPRPRWACARSVALVCSMLAEASCSKLDNSVAMPSAPLPIDGRPASELVHSKTAHLPRHVLPRVHNASGTRGVREPLASDAPGPWASPEACESALMRAERAHRNPGIARIGTWNVRWFPDGVPGSVAPASRATDLKWLGCSIAWMNVDALALQEVKATQAAREALQALVLDLTARTSSNWKAYLDECPERNGQHLAWLIDMARVQTTEFIQHANINPYGSACASQLRPGWGVTLRFPGGLDLHVLTVHLKSGATERDVELRHRSWDALIETASAVARHTNAADVLVLGDFNSMGCRTCEVPTGGGSELSNLDRRLLSAETPLRRIGADLPCSHYYDKQPGSLDHAVVTSGTREIASNQTALIEGYCRALRCEPFAGKEPDAYLRLSDHCPVVVELLDQDLD